MTRQQRNRLIALAATLLFHGAIVALLLLTWLFPATSSQLMADKAQADDESEIVLLGTEYVMTGDVDILADDASANEPASSATTEAESAERPGNALEASGQPGDPLPQLSSNRPSPAKTTVRPTDNTGTSKPSDSKKTTDPNKQESPKIKNNYVNFGSSSSDKPKGNSGSPTGNADNGSTLGNAEINLPGRTKASWTNPKASAAGTIVIRVTVSPDGRVTSASYKSGSGPVASDPAARASCIAAARSSRFSVSTDQATSQTGTITYRFRAPASH